MDGRDVVKPKNWLESLNCAIEGVIYAFRTQKHVRYHYVIALAALILSLILKLPVFEFVLFTVSIVILLFAEMMNTALEETVNLVEEKHHMIAKNAKDVSAGAVLVSSIGVFVTGYMIFAKYLIDPLTKTLVTGKVYAGHLAVISLLMVLIAVVFIKATVGKGRPLHGGMPSGHAAVAFSISTAITLITLNPLIAALSVVLAFMVGNSRRLGGIHTRTEVFAGGMLGIGMTLLVFWIYSLTP